MTVITINDLDESSYLNELSDIDSDATRGGILPLIAAAWLGYQIGKEIARLT
ncbi:hypothetical protein ACWATR_13595 [Nostoc sp. UIC 10890]